MAKKKIAVIGSNGQLGNDLIKILSKKPYNLFGLSHKDIEITDPGDIKKTLGIINPNIIINAAAYNQVDDIEVNPEKGFLINSLGNKYLAEFAKNNNSEYISVSTNYVFGIDEEKKSPYSEEDFPGPVNVYGITKLAGEYFSKYSCSNSLIFRTCGLYGISSLSGKKGNFVDKMIKLANEKKTIQVVNDQFVSPTYSMDLAKQIEKTLNTESYGLYHATSEGFCSWYEFAKEIFSILNLKTNLVPVSSLNYKTLAKRPMYSVLENKNLKNLNLNIMRHWKEGLKDYLREKKLV